jgi:hypothetical protein
MACETQAAMRLVGSHWLDDTQGRDGVKPAQPVCRWVTNGIYNEQVEVWSIEGGTLEPLLNVETAALGVQVVR